MMDDMDADQSNGLSIDATASETGAALAADFAAGTPSKTLAQSQDLIMRIPVTVQIVIGKTKMAVADLVKLGPGSIVTLDRGVGEPVDLVVNGHLVARGQLVVLDEDNSRFGISLTEVVESPASNR